jgi:hypothetical protein
LLNAQTIPTIIIDNEVRITHSKLYSQELSTLF